ncbi:Phage tail protein (Tail_P2_I) [Blastococcus sp. DSM 46786]|uniref:phage tail protein n=1 Tax=Blastococcus sp. DSM 46786 TaxID=1798227 RepID=UPI0008C3E2F8|nr:phage tail protein [Blastococcus sp. DSM 46786]SEK59847.1 Phage tail protein (Tail_P2_I) [Blastococcus sp. DSM 46786]
MTDYPYDPDSLRRTAELLLAHVPEFHRRADRAAQAADPPRRGELAVFLEVMAAPLAAVRQSIEELYGDLFVDTAGEDVLPTLAASIGLDLVFRDAGANRRDLRAAMARRRRKGTPAMLEEMGRALVDRQVTTREGWRAVLVAQDLDLLRPERTTPDLRSVLLPERLPGSGPVPARMVDPRPVTARTGHAHPRHLVHLAFLSRLHPLLAAACSRLPDGPGDLRFAFDAANDWRWLRVRATGTDDRPGTDRVPEGPFAAAPGDWHGRDGRFTVRFTGLPAAARHRRVLRSARRVPADRSVLAGPVTIEVLETDGDRTSGPVELELLAVPGTPVPDETAAVSCARLVLDAGGGQQTAAGGGVPDDAVALVRLRPQAPAVSRTLGESVVAITGATGNAHRAPGDPELAVSGYRRGALLVRVPAMRLDGPRWFYVGADGSLHDAEEPGGAGLRRPLEVTGGTRRLPPRSVVSKPVGPAFPEAPETAERAPFAPALIAPGAAPVPVHGLRVLEPAGGGGALPGSRHCALVLTLTYAAAGRVFEPMLRLAWQGDDPRAARWEPLDARARPAGSAAGRLAELVDSLRTGRNDVALAMRFECEVRSAVLTPGEMAVTAVDGRAVLVHLPELVADAGPVAAWPRGPAPLTAQSEPVQVGADGSTWVAGTNRLRRRALGAEVPLLGPVAVRRREVRWRRLCAWRNETATEHLDPTPPGRLDVDPRFGLFSVAASEPPVGHPEGPVPPPPPVTVDVQVGSTMEVGALPVDRDRLLNRPPRRPTRLVCASGHLGRGTPPDWLGLPLHRRLSDALAAVDTGGAAVETIRLVDSAYYAQETLIWPATPSVVVVEAAAGARPVVEIVASAPGAAAYERLELVGVALLPAPGAPVDVVLPPAQRVELAFVSVLDADLSLTVRLAEAAGTERLTVLRSALTSVDLAQPGEVEVTDSILDPGKVSRSALTAPEAHLTMVRSTVVGRLRLGQVDAGDSILAGEVTARELFRGCIRYSLLVPGGATPRKHRVVRPDPGTGAPVRLPFVSADRRDPAYLRLDPGGDLRILTGASDGGEMGVFNGARLGELCSGLALRLAEHTPAGLHTGVVLRD